MSASNGTPGILSFITSDAGAPATPSAGTPLLLTVDQAAEYLGVGRSTMYGLIQDGEVESVHIGRLHRVPADALTAFLSRLRGQAAGRSADLSA